MNSSEYIGGLSARRHRVAELLCGYHRAVCTEYWPTHGPATDLVKSCADCLAVARSVTEGQDFDMRVPDWGGTAFGLEHDAFHEAGHAVAAVVGGVPIRRVRLGALVIESAVTTSGVVQAAGGVDIGDGTSAVEDFAAFVWSGLRASRKWLADNGNDTIANLIDSTSKGGHDVAALRVALDPHSLPIGTGRDRADELLARYWPAVQTLAITLLRERTLTGAAVTDLLTPLLPQSGQ